MKVSRICRTSTKVFKTRFTPNTRIPLSVYLSVTDRCPHACEYCNIPNRALREMTTEEIISLVRQVKNTGAERLQLVGGEPLLRKDIGTIINYAKDEGLYVTASSTGFFPEKIEAIKNIDLIFLSFDGDERIHDAHKGRGTYARLMETIRICKVLGVNFMTTTVITKLNKDTIDFILQTARANNFMTVFQPLYYTLNDYQGHFHLARVSDKFVLTNEEIREVFKRLIIAKRDGARLASSLRYLEYIVKWKDYQQIYSPHKDSHVKCWAGRLYCYIDTNGLLYPCGDSIGRVKGSDCLTDGFASAFHKMNLNYGCQSCIVACDLEKNLMFSLNLRTIINWLKVVI